MLYSVLLSLASTPAPVVLVQDYGVEAQIGACAEDIAKLEALAATFKEAGDRASSRRCHERILELDENHRGAHKALGHYLSDGRWYESFAAFVKHRRDKEKRMKEEFGLVRHKDQWVLETELPYIRMGWKKEGDTYIDPHVAARRRAKVAFEAKGYKQRREDSTWISPDEFYIWKQGLYRIDDEWFTLAEANAYHAEIGQWWKRQGEHFQVYTTCDKETAEWVEMYADLAYPDLVRLFGVQPEEKPIVCVLNSLDQYCLFADDKSVARRLKPESTGFSSSYHAFFADSWFDMTNPHAPEYLGGGVAYYDVSDDVKRLWGRFAVRHAAALSFVDSIDRAWNLIGKFPDNLEGGRASWADQMWEEKQIPKWLSYGAGAYVEYFKSMTTENHKDGLADTDPWRIRHLFLTKMASTRKLSPLEEIFALPLTRTDSGSFGRLVHESGILTAFILDGNCEPVIKTHGVFKEALRAGDASQAVAALQQAILDNAEALVAFSGLDIEATDTKAAARAASASRDGDATDGAAADGADNDG
ncbi:MAG: hypothetical protein CMJ89_15615 [Planctomycetes bacterium]|nr:hypothetical protein [Planctomycetota bacterium]